MHPAVHQFQIFSRFLYFLNAATYFLLFCPTELETTPCDLPWKIETIGFKHADQF